MKSEYLAEVKVVTIPNYAIGLVNTLFNFSLNGFFAVISR